MECALGHPRKDVYHGIQTILLVALRECYHFQAECEKGTFEESVHQEHLTCNIKSQLLQELLNDK